MSRNHRRQPGTFVKNHVNPDDPMVKRACTNKKKHRTKQRASRAANWAEKRSGLETSYYHCRLCGWFHIYRVKDEAGNFISVVRNLVPTVTKLKAVQ